MACKGPRSNAGADRPPKGEAGAQEGSAGVGPDGSGRGFGSDIGISELFQEWQCVNILETIRRHEP